MAPNNAAVVIIFLAGYETGVSGYKHVYFNSTRQTLAIWIITVFAVIGLYEAIRHVATLLYTGRFEFGFRTRLRIVQNVYLNYLFCFLIDNYSARIEQLTNTLCLNTDFKRKSQKTNRQWPTSDGRSLFHVHLPALLRLVGLLQLLQR